MVWLEKRLKKLIIDKLIDYKMIKDFVSYIMLLFI